MSLVRACTAALAFVAAACLLPASAVRSQATVHLVVGGQITDDTTPILYALKAGLFKRAGLDVELQKTLNGGTAMPALLGGTFNIADSNVLSIAGAHIKGIPVEIVSPGIVYDGTPDFVAAVVKKDSTLSTGADLNNKIVAVSTIGDLNAIALEAWMDQHGGNSKTIKQIELAWSDVGPALDAGRVDVGTLVQPILAQTLATGKVRVFARTSDAISQRFLITAWIATKTFTSANPDAIRRFARVVREAQAYCNSHKAETAPLLAAYTGASVEGLLKGGRATYAADYVNTGEVTPVIAAAFKYGAVPEIVDAHSIISPAIASLAGP